MSFRKLCISVAAAGLTACAAPGTVTAPQMPDTEVFFYPQANQSPAQQDRDRYECYLWAVEQTGFDPSQPGLTAPRAVTVEPAPAPGAAAAAGAITGAVVGAMIGAPHDSGEGAAVGAVAGAMIGGAAEQSAQDRQAAEVAGAQGELDRQALRYRRAMSACLEGRGYAVQ
jgi:hypothetical protein